MKLKVKITEDIQKLVKGLFIKDFGNKVGIDKYNVFGQDRLYEDMARILGLLDHIRVETIEEWDGAKFDDETTEKLYEIGGYLNDHIVDIEEILHQFCTEGLRVGTYTCLDNVRIWKYEGQTD